MNAIEYASKAETVFVLPDAVVRIRDLIEDDTASMEDIADVIKFDPSLMAQVLKIANSALYNFPSEISTINKAIQVIGTNSIYDLVVAYGVANAFSQIDTTVIDLDRFWEQSVSCALLAKFYGEKLKLGGAERLFVSGLLHNIGELVVVKLNPSVAQRCANISEKRLPLGMQLDNLGFTYAEIGAELIRMWGIPKEISSNVASQHHTQFMAQTDEQKIMQLSYVVALDISHNEFYPNNANLEKPQFEKLGFEKADVTEGMDFAGIQAMSVLALFNPGTFAMF